MAKAKVKEEVVLEITPMSPDMLEEILTGDATEKTVDNPEGILEEDSEVVPEAVSTIQTGVLVSPKALLVGSHRFTHAPFVLKVDMPKIPEGSYAILSLYPELARKTRIRLATAIVLPGDDEVELVLDNYGIDAHMISKGDPVALFVIDNGKVGN